MVVLIAAASLVALALAIVLVAGRGMFDGIAARALERNNASFLELATSRLATTQAEASGALEQRQQAIRHLVEPIEHSLGQVSERLRELELARTEAYVSLTEQVANLRDTQELLRDQTGNLVTALRAPAARGRWGELQLRRAIELAGMLRHCDFVEQPSVTTADGRLRPDVVVQLPGGKQVVVDAKVPMQAYLEAVEATDDTTRTRRLVDHARQLRNHVTQLSAKAYWEQFSPSPDFVVLFVPGDALLGAALEHDPSLLDDAAGMRVLLATPVTLIAVLRAVAMGWRQEALADNAREVCELGRELYKRLSVLGDHVGGVGRNLERAVDSYNRAVGSLESRVMVTARRFVDLDVADEALAPLDPVDRVPRRLHADELVAGHDRLVPLPADGTDRV